MLEFYKLMKNNIFFISIFLFFSNFLLAEEFDIKAKNIKIDKKSKITIFENEVEVIDEFNNLLMQYSNQSPYPDIDK